MPAPRRGEVALFGDGDEQAQVGQVIAHGNTAQAMGQAFGIDERTLAEWAIVPCNKYPHHGGLCVLPSVLTHAHRALPSSPCPMPWKHWSSERLGLTFALLAALGFSFKAIFVKLAYAVPQAVPVDSVTLLALRMAFSMPFFVWVAGAPAARCSRCAHATGCWCWRWACWATTARASSTSWACSTSAPAWSG